MSGALFDEHHRELAGESAISEEVIAGRGYRSISRPTNTHDEPRQEMKRAGIPTWAINENRYFPGLFIPLYRPTGERISGMFKPRVPVPNRDGRAMKYAAQKNRPSVIDVHPINRDRIVDPTVPLWITEGVKKADSLTSRGLCVAALSGVYNWRSGMGSLGDWEDIPLRGRTITICFDADARTNPNVLRAMDRFGRWLRSKGVGQVLYLIVPDKYQDTPVKGADDWFAAGGSLAQLSATATTTCPRADSGNESFTDSRLAETVADEVLDHGYCYALGRGWLKWDGRRWMDSSDIEVTEEVRVWALKKYMSASRNPDSGSAQIDGWRTMLSVSRQRTIVAASRGLVLKRASEFDSHPDVINTPSGIVDLETLQVMPHDPDMLLTKITGASYRPDADHHDWKQALQALPKNVRHYMQIRLGQAITGHMTPDDLLIVMHGGGENGKSTFTDILSKAIGDYFLLVSDRALMASPDAHPTELMDFQGARLAVMEETPEARRLNTQRLKRTVGTPQITARRIRMDPVTFDATHSLFINTNFRPTVEETDHGTWRRLALVSFPYRFRKPHEAVEKANDRIGDPGLRERSRNSPQVREAALAWLIEGARMWYENDRTMPEPPASVVADTRAWRGETDLVMAYLDDRIVIDPASHVLSMELLDDFNDWLKARRHPAWSDKTFISRLDGHEDVRDHGVELKKMRAQSGLSRPPLRTSIWGMEPQPSATAATYRAWKGLRFRTTADDVDLEGAEKPSTSEIEDHVPHVPPAKYDENSLHESRHTFSVEHVEHKTSSHSFVPHVPGEVQVDDEAEPFDFWRVPRDVLCDDCGYLTTTRHHHRVCLPSKETQ
jgi:P4 family phage/plasmid primase-like protien